MSLFASGLISVVCKVNFRVPQVWIILGNPEHIEYIRGRRTASHCVREEVPKRVLQGNPGKSYVSRLGIYSAEVIGECPCVSVFARAGDDNIKAAIAADMEAPK